MNVTRIIGLILIVAGIAALGMGGFSFTKETHQLKIGPVELSVKEKQDVELPDLGRRGGHRGRRGAASVRRQEGLISDCFSRPPCSSTRAAGEGPTRSSA